MEEINLYDLLRYYARNWLNLLSAVLIGAIIGVVYTAFIQTPLYKSNATILVVGASTSTTGTTLNNNYTELFKSRLVLQDTIVKQGYSGDYETLLARTTVNNDKNNDVIRISIADTDPSKSQQLLSTAVNIFKEQAGKIYRNSGDNLRTIDTATLPATPYNVKTIMQIGLAMAAAFFAAVIVLFFVYDYTTSYKGGKGGKSGGNGKGSQDSVRTKTATTKVSPARKKPATKPKGKSTKKSESYAGSLVRRARAALVSGNKPAAKVQSKS